MITPTGAEEHQKDKLRAIFEDPKKKIYLHITVVSLMILVAYFREVSYPIAEAIFIKGVIVILLFIQE
jgi:hypothetical protein